jgi:hypothetical protein
VLGIGLALAAVVLIGLWTNRESGLALIGRPAQPTVGVRAAEAPIIVTGVGSRTSSPFYLAGGTYRGAWSAWGEAAEFPPCTHSAELLAVDPANAVTGGHHVSDLALLVDVRATGASDESYINLKPGEYYLDVTSACSWQISLSPNS